MRVFVKVFDRNGKEGSTYLVPCKGESGVSTVAGLKREALARALSETGDDGRAPECFQLSMAGQGAVLAEQDSLEDVLCDGDFLCLREYLLYMAGVTMVVEPQRTALDTGVHEAVIRCYEHCSHLVS